MLKNLITQEISIESGVSSLTALLFCGSYLFHFGVPFKSDIDVKLLVNGEPWEAISEFMRRYQEKFGDQGKTEWVNDFRYKSHTCCPDKDDLNSLFVLHISANFC